MTGLFDGSVSIGGWIFLVSTDINQLHIVRCTAKMQNFIYRLTSVLPWKVSDGRDHVRHYFQAAKE